jgi:hypothetical protein
MRVLVWKDVDMAIAYDIGGPATAISIKGQAGLGFNFYAAQRVGDGTIGPVDPSPFRRCISTSLPFQG